ncbi:hypothetical protein HMN09_01017200 [Mycena chlorophos]|uniref:DUF6534 domain-containing protein n=1 Tax=Mycena chlorophos TaxID=658473 RepID=A0A8H6W1B4_MYCCL|nr:hypothetical protein HMN09_01017200 [Mycena chlorophos]
MSSSELSTQLLNETLGALQIGVLLSYMLLGVTTMQVYIYVGRFPQDPRWLRAMVGIVWLMELVQGGLVGYALYLYTVLDYGDRLHILQSAPPTLNAAFVLTALITTVVQLFFIHRIWLLSKNVYLPGVLVIMSIVYLVGILGFAGVGFKASKLAELEASMGWDVEADAILSVVLDTAIAVSLVVLLLQSRRQGMASTTNMVDKLIAWSIETGVITSICSVLILAIYETKPASFIWLAVFIVKSRLYSNSLLASLNSRIGLRAQASNVTVSTPSLAPRFATMVTQTRTVTVGDVELYNVNTSAAGLDSSYREDSDAKRNIMSV